MKKIGYAVIAFLIAFIAIVGVNAVTPQAPSAVIHQVLDANNQSMLSKAQIMIKEIESNPEKTELDSTFFKHPAATWKIVAHEGNNAIMIDITVEDERVSYKQHLSGVKKKGESAEYTQYSIYLN